MEIPRIRILRRWDRTKTSMRGYWLLLIEPRWPVFRFERLVWEDDLKGIFTTKEDDSMDIILEHFDRTRSSGDCKGTIWAYDIFDLKRYLFK